jgi:3-oxoacyl-[acyl-carrier-protein] synthase-3
VPAKILGIEYHLPERVETNEDLQRENPDWRMDQLTAKLGIKARHIAAPSETSCDLGYAAAKKLLDRGLAPPESIDYLIFCTQSPDYFLPTGACLLQQRLGLGKHVAAFDFNLGCSGYVYGLQMAKAFIVSGEARNVLLVTGETYTKFIHPRDRTVRALFGDGAAATLIGHAAEGDGIGQFELGSDGAGAQNLIVPAGAARVPCSRETSQEYTDNAGCVRSRENLFMDGPAIFTFAISAVPKMVDALLKKTGFTANDIDWFVYHQANRYMLEELARRSQIPADRMIIDLADVGNTVSASIPIALQRAVAKGQIRPGQRLLLAGFGVGYSWGACDVVWSA